MVIIDVRAEVQYLVGACYAVAGVSDLVYVCMCVCICGYYVYMCAVITNVASLVLGYDMRRLNDITAFKRYWYRTSLVEAIFIGSKKTPEDDSLSSTLALDSSAGQGDVTSAVLSLDNTVSAAIVVAASIDDFRVSANVAQVMGNAE